MPIVRAGRVLLCAAAATSLAGCAGSRLSPDAPAGVNLAGAWKLNRAASDAPQKVLDRMRAEAFKRIARRVTAGSRPDGRGGGTRTREGPLRDVIRRARAPRHPVGVQSEDQFDTGRLPAQLGRDGQQAQTSQRRLDLQHPQAGLLE